MRGIAEKTDPKLWDKVKDEVTSGDKGGRAGQWSARKAQLATAAYKDKGGGYKGKKTADNHLRQWTAESWGTKSGEASAQTGERYLPEAARDSLSARDYARTSDKKRQDTKAGRQFSAQPPDVARKTAPYRRGQPTRADLYAEARRRNIAGRSKMTRAELERALAA